MRQRDNSLSMKSALRNPRTPGTAGRGGLKWSDNLEVRAATNVECVSETPKTETARPPAAAISRPLRPSLTTLAYPRPRPRRRTLGRTPRATRWA